MNLFPEEVYVFTPKGRVITLPLGSSALDFAFKIHTEVGYHAHKAIISGKPAPLKTILSTGDIVEVITAPDVTPKREWLNIAFTSTARQRIKRWLNIQDKIKKTTIGKKLWEKEIKKYHQIPAKYLEEKNLIKRLSETTAYRIKKIEDFYSLLGSGKILLNRKFMEHVFSTEKAEKHKEAAFTRVARKTFKKEKPILVVKGGKDSLVNLAKCCSPIKGESILGYITSGKGITIHSYRCPLVTKDMLDGQRIVEASWDDAAEGSYIGKLLIKSQDSPGVLAKVASAIAQLEGNIKKADITTSADLKAQLRLVLIIKDIRHLDSIIKKITGIKEIISVKRI